LFNEFVIIKSIVGQIQTVVDIFFPSRLVVGSALRTCQSVGRNIMAANRTLIGRSWLLSCLFSHTLTSEMIAAEPDSQWRTDIVIASCFSWHRPLADVLLVSPPAAT